MDMAAVEDRLVIEYVPINQLRPFGGNPRKISEKGLHKLKRSVEEFGFVNPILVQKGTNIREGLLCLGVVGCVPSSPTTAARVTVGGRSCLISRPTTHTLNRLVAQRTHC